MLAACGGRGQERPAVIRLVDRFAPTAIEGAVAPGPFTSPRTEWRFDGPPPAPPAKAFTATRGWEAGPGVANLAVADGRLEGRTTSDFPMIRVERSSGLDNPDQLHAIEIRLRVSAGANLEVTTSGTERVDMPNMQGRARAIPWRLATPIVAGPEFQTYTVTSPSLLPVSRIRHLLIRPTDAVGAAFAIESVRLITRKEYLASIPSGVGWQGLREIYRESLVARAPETLRFPLRLAEHPALDVAVGTIDETPVTFRVMVGRLGSGEPAVVFERTVSTPFRWEPRVIDLSSYAGTDVTVSLSLASSQPGTIGLWGTPVVRSRGAIPAASSANASRPQGVIVIQADTLRRDDLDAYGYGRETAPTVRRLAAEGALFQHAVSQAPWTKVSTPSIMTSLYATTHGVHRIGDRLPSSATTLAEVYRRGGYATVQFSSNSFTGFFTNLHRGFEEVDEDGSLERSAPNTSKTAREYVDRLIDWIARHRGDPFFAFLHVNDPHAPYEPRGPYKNLWVDAASGEAQRRDAEAVRTFIAAPGRQATGMATRDELWQAGVDPDEYITRARGLYDSSIRGLDVELGRLFEALRDLGLDERTLLVFLSDHGEEFHDHAAMWHGQSVYGELMNVPLIMRWPGGLKKGLVIDDYVQLIDVMPTLLDLSGLEHPKGLQGRSLRPLLLDSGPAASRPKRPVISERPAPEVIEVDPDVTEAYAVIEGDWKLIHNRARKPHVIEFELYDLKTDAHEQTNIASQHSDVVARLAQVLESWHKTALAARVKSDSESTQGLSKEQLQRLRSLGYVK